MKRSTSRASKYDADTRDANENSVAGLPEVKWKELIEKEESDLFILGIREEIIETCMKICYENYLKRQTVAFTVHCAHSAWVKVIGVYYMFKDPGDTDDPVVKKSWEPDEEPEPSAIDSWASQCIQAVEPEPPVKEDEEVQVEQVIPEVEETIASSSLYGSHLPEAGEASFYYPHMSENNTYIPVREKSIFSKTLSMSKESLIWLEPVGLQDCRGVGLLKKNAVRDKRKI